MKGFLNKREKETAPIKVLLVTDPLITQDRIPTPYNDLPPVFLAWTPSPTSLHANTGLLIVPQTSQPQSYLRTFALVFPLPEGNASPRSSHRWLIHFILISTPISYSQKGLLWLINLKKPPPTTVIYQALFLIHLSCFIFLYSGYHYMKLLCLCSVFPLDNKLLKIRNLSWSLLYL